MVIQGAVESVAGVCGDVDEVEILRKIYRFAKALRILEEKDPLYTREFLRIISDWGDSFELLKEMSSIGLIERYVDYCRGSRGRKCVYNRVTKKGKELLILVDRLISLVNEDPPPCVTQIE